MQLLTWNIQCGKGCDGVTDLARIVRVAKAMGDIDVFCFQEISDNFSKLDNGTDQSAIIAALLPNYVPVFRPAIESVGGGGTIHRFGNMTLSRLPVLQITNHLLPWPEADKVRSMRRHALDVTVMTASRALRIVNTHLEYHSAEQRDAQIVRLLDLQQEASTSPISFAEGYLEPYSSQVLAPSGVMCGDFNFDVSDPQFTQINQSTRPGLNYRDAWATLNPLMPRALTCGLFDRVQWSSGPDCRDFVFVTEDLVEAVRRNEVNVETDASDHQPILMELAS